MKRSLLILALAAAIPFSAQAADLSYNYVEADYLNQEHGTDGWGLRGAYDFGGTGWYGLAGYSRLNIDAFGGNDNVDSYELGGGYHYGLTGRTDLIGELAYQRSDVGPFNVSGWRGSMGVRSALSDKLEGFVKANYYDGHDYDGDFTGTLGAQYKFTKTWGATVEGEFGNGNKNYLLGARASF